MSKIAVIHFAPLELYPPIQNLLNELARERANTTIDVFTTSPIQTVLSPFRVSSDRINLIRIGKSDMRLSPFLRYINYFRFFFSVLLRMLWYRYEKIMYFETISSWPAYIYKRFFKKDCEIVIHYHEYTTPDEYEKGMKLTRYFHRLEKQLYSDASWVSHTNLFRMEKFKKDLFPVVISNPRIIPNYPPRKWHQAPRHVVSLPVKIVYVGALSLTTMYTKEFSNWVVEQKGKVIWDIFSYNHSVEAMEYIRCIHSENVRMHEGVSYDRLPGILKGYDVGVILYNGHIPNYVYNAPNKLFEYLTCGLDVWFPQPMIGSNEFITAKGFPKVVAIDFADLGNFDFSTALKRDGEENKRTFFCEDALLPLINKLTHP